MVGQEQRSMEGSGDSGESVAAAPPPSLGQVRIILPTTEGVSVHGDIGDRHEWREIKPRIAISRAAHREAGSSDRTPLAGVF